MNKKKIVLLITILIITLLSVLIISYANNETYTISSDLKDEIGDIDEEIIKAIIENGERLGDIPICGMCLDHILEGSKEEEILASLEAHKLECDFYSEEYAEDYYVDYARIQVPISDDKELTKEEVENMVALEIDGSKYNIEDINVLIEKILPVTVGLETLKLQNCGLDDLDFVSSLTMLSDLDVSGNNIESIKDVFDDLENLASIDVSENYLDIYNESFGEESETLEYIESLSASVIYEPQKVKEDATNNEPIEELTDENLLKLINYYIKGEAVVAPVGKKEILRLEELDSSVINDLGKIQSLEGLKYAKNLKSINLVNNLIDDMSVLLDEGELKLDNLTFINIDKNYLERLEGVENPNEDFFKKVEEINNNGDRTITIINMVKYFGPVSELDEFVEMKDEKLNAILKSKLGLLDEYEITRADLLKIEELDLSNKDITDVSALMFLNNAKTINLSGNNTIKDLSALQYAYSVEKLDLSNMELIHDENSLLDVYLKGLPYLKTLDLSDNKDLQKVNFLSKLRLMQGDYNYYGEDAVIEKPKTLIDLSNTGIIDIDMLSSENINYSLVNPNLEINVTGTPAIEENFDDDTQKIIDEFPVTIIYSDEDYLVFVRLQLPEELPEVIEEEKYKVSVYGKTGNVETIKYVQLTDEEVELETEQNKLDAFKALEESSTSVDLTTKEFSITTNGKYLVYVKVEDKEYVKVIEVTNITVEEPEDSYELIEEPTIVLNKESTMVTGIEPQSSAEDITSQFQNLGTDVTVKVYKKYEEDSTENEELTSGNVGTGMKLVVEKAGEKLEEYTIVIYGDVNGDGKINMSDITLLIKHIVGKNILENEKLQAGNANRDTETKVAMSDITIMIKHIVGKQSINQY